MSDRKLFDAAGRGDEALVSQLIELGAEVDYRGGADYTALHHAATPRVVTKLLDSGWSLEARNSYVIRVIGNRRHFMMHPVQATPES